MEFPIYYRNIVVKLSTRIIYNKFIIAQKIELESVL